MDCPEVAHTKLEPAVIEQIREVMVCLPLLDLDEPRKFTEILQLGRFCCARPVAEQIGRLLAPTSRPGRALLADFFIEALISRRHVRWISAKRVLHRDELVSRIEHLIKICHYAQRGERAVDGR